MVRKRTRQKAKKGEESTDNLVRRSEGHMASGRYKDAIDAYKRLLKKEPGEKWQVPLARAYLARAKSLADKSMYQEALVMWEHRAHLLGEEVELGLYISWLLRAGRREKALNCYQANKAKLERADVDRIEAMLASQRLSGDTSYLEGLVEASPVVGHFPRVEAVISAYCRGDDSQLPGLLKAIAYRSPYRDFRSVFSALIVLPEQAQTAMEMLDRLATDSPFQGFANVVRMIASGDVKNLNKLSQASKQFATQVNGINPQLLPLLNKLNRDASSARSLLGHLLSSSKIIEKKQLQPLCLSLLPTYPVGIKQYNQHFEPLSDFAIARIKALAAEQDDDLETAVRHWETASRVLRQQIGFDKNHAAMSLKAALILRHTVELYERLFGPNHPAVEDLLLDSLDCDETDKPTYLKLLASYRTHEEADEYRQMLDRTVKQFPEDTDILLMAVELAIQRNTFRKATRLAGKILQKDPLNMRVRTLLIDAHLAHARKQMLAKRLDLADKEIEAAQAMERSGSESGRVNIYRGLLAQQQGELAEAKIQLEQACAYQGEQLTYFRVLIEAEELRLPIQDLRAYQKSLKQTAKKPPMKADLMALLKVIQAYKDEDLGIVHTALTPLQNYLKKAVKLDYTRDEMEMICETWKKTGCFMHLQNYAKQALQIWPEASTFIYYQVLGSSAGGSRPLKPGDTENLMRALELLRESGNFKLLEHILELIEPEPYSFMNMLAQKFRFDDDDEEEDEYDDDKFPFPPF